MVRCVEACFLAVGSGGPPLITGQTWVKHSSHPPEAQSTLALPHEHIMAPHSLRDTWRIVRMASSLSLALRTLILPSL